MATRQETGRRSESLKHALREACRVGDLPLGAPAPPVRELAQEHKLSVNLVCRALGDLVAEGVLHTVPRVGTFVGLAPSGIGQRADTTSGAAWRAMLRARAARSSEEADEWYLMLLPGQRGLTEPEHGREIQNGFEGRVARRGGASLAIPIGQALESRRRGELPPLAGVFDFAYQGEAESSWGFDREGDENIVPRVGFLGRIEDEAHSDTVSYDDFDGGRQATRHLLALGHRTIAFLALHPARDEESAPHEYSCGVWNETVWSQEREQGWREALREVGVRDGLSFHPASAPGAIALGATREEEIEGARQVSESLVARLVARGDITAVVAANDYAALGLFQALRESRVPSRSWPAVVGFDNLPGVTGQVMSSLRLPGEAIGRAAADLLWERKHKRLVGPPQHRRVAMCLHSRLSSRPQWTLLAGPAALAAMP